jgi:hypothetical protein
MGTDILTRISGRLGQPIDLNTTFFRNGIPTDPYAIVNVSIYSVAVKRENLITVIPISFPWDPNYPSPLSRDEGSSGAKPGVFHLIWDVPTNITVPNIFFDVWNYLPDNPGISSSLGITAEENLLNDESLQRRCCNEFWLYPEGFSCTDDLTTIRFGFEPIDIKFHQPEVRTLEVGLMPLPLYDFDYNKIMPIIPFLKAFISISTEHCEPIIVKQPMKIGLRAGMYRSNPFTLQTLIDTTKFLKGSYTYSCLIQLPNGETRSSPQFILQIS